MTGPAREPAQFGPAVLDPSQAGLVHGMGKELVEPDWPPLTDAEVRVILARYPAADASVGAGAVITWRSPRPWSAAALVRCPVGAAAPASSAGPAAARTVFVKRHHASVRSVAQLTAEHAFAAHLRARGVPVPAIWRDGAGATATARGDFVYELHDLAAGADLYRDATSWSPFTSPQHAWSAGAALARLHVAGASFALPERPPAALMGSCAVVIEPDPLAALTRFIARLPSLTRYLSGRPWQADARRHLLGPIGRAAPLLRALPRQWGHGDWHPSNLTWTGHGPDATVAGVLDLGLANRTLAVHDLATALERATVPWLDLGESPGDASSRHVEADLAAADALLDGYETVRPLSGIEAAALAEVLPVVHVEFALSEVEYFAGIRRSPQNADLAYSGYLLGHARWFAGPQASGLLDHLRRRARRATTARSTTSALPPGRR